MKDKLMQIIFRPAAEEIESLQARVVFWRTGFFGLLIIVLILTLMTRS